ncbi:MAG: branched-chain amino acid ABC transporter permease [Streptomycetales bacterium]
MSVERGPTSVRTAATAAWVRWWPWAVGALAVLGCIGLQTQLFVSQERTVTAVFMFVALAQSWNLIGGYTGYACFGQVVFFGLGGYTTAVLMAHLHMSFWLALVTSGLVAALFGGAIGLPLLRLKGHYFAIATLGVAEGMREVVTNLPALTGGGAGITVPTFGADAPTPYIDNDGFYVLFMILAVFSVLVVGLVARGKFGLALRAIHQDEDAAAAAGVNTTRAKVTAFALSGFLGGLAGASYAFEIVTIFPERLFDVELTVLMVIMVVVGGSGTIIGPVLGAVALQFLSEWLRQSFTQAHTFILGGIIILVVVLLPEGLVPYLRHAWRTRDFSLLTNIRRYRL